MGKTYYGETQIRIPDDTLVLICGSQSSGKTTFTKKHFATKSIVTTDEIFEDVVENHSSVFDTMDSLAEKTTEIFEKKVIQSSKEHSISIYNVIFFYYFEFISFFSKWFIFFHLSQLSSSRSKIEEYFFALYFVFKSIILEAKKITYSPVFS